MLVLVPPDFIFHPVEGGIPTRDEARFLPYGALSIASFLRSRGQRAMVAPLQWYFQRGTRYRHFDDGTEASREAFEQRTRHVLEALMRRLRPRALGVSIGYAIHHSAAEIILGYLHRFWPEIPVLVGGNHATHTREHWLNACRGVDAVVCGPGEAATLAWLEARRSPAAPAALRRHRADDEAASLAVPVDLDLAALPHWAPVGGFMHLLATSRGCSHRCAFCTSRLMWRRRQGRPREAYTAELEGLVARGVDRVLLADDMLDPRDSGFAELVDVLARFESIRFGAPLRLDSLRHCNPRSLTRAHIEEVFVGLESFSPEILRAMRKDLRVDCLARIDTDLCRLRDAGLKVTLFMLVGHPGATRSLDMVSIERCQTLVERGVITGLSAVHVAPYPGTALASMVERGRLRIIEPRMNRWTLDRPIVEELDPAGRPVYPEAEQRATFEAFQDICRRTSAYVERQRARLRGT